MTIPIHYNPENDIDIDMKDFDGYDYGIRLNQDVTIAMVEMMVCETKDLPDFYAKVDDNKSKALFNAMVELLKKHGQELEELYHKEYEEILLEH